MKNDDVEHFFEELYFRYAIKLERMCYKYVSYQNEYTSIIEESIQETFLQAIKQYHKLQSYSPSHLEAWLVETCWNRLKPAVKKYRRRKNDISVLIMKNSCIYLLNGFKTMSMRYSNVFIAKKPWKSS